MKYSTQGKDKRENLEERTFPWTEEAETLMYFHV